VHLSFTIQKASHPTHQHAGGTGGTLGALQQKKIPHPQQHESHALDGLLCVKHK
jgi:hypothetical protein